MRGKDWRDDINKSSTDDELPDPKLIALKHMQNSTAQNPIIKLQLIEGDETNESYNKIGLLED